MKFKRVVLKLSNNSFSSHNNIEKFEISAKVKRKRMKERKEREKTS
jgi:hypothetical protein